jgi:hypothetical protein
MYGHGTHLAGIIAGADPGLPTRPNDRWLRTNFAGVAPGAHIVNVKVADATGTADVSQVIAGIQWVIEHKDDGPADIRVLTLAFGTDSVQDYRIDPLAHAAESAWHAGIVVVVAAGNDGGRSPLRDPANDPFVIAVGATDPGAPHASPTIGSCPSRTAGPRTVPSTSSHRVGRCRACGWRVRSSTTGSPRLQMATASSVEPVRRRQRRWWRARLRLMLDHRPEMTPDQVKATLLRTCGRCPIGARQLRRRRGARHPAGGGGPARCRRSQDWDRSDGSGSIEASRGSYHVYRDGEPLTGEVDVTGGTWSGGTRRHLVRRHLVRRHLVRRHLVRRHLERRHLERRHLERRHLVRRHLVRRHLVRRHLVRRHLVRRHLVRRHLVRRHLERRHLVGRRLELTVTGRRPASPASTASLAAHRARHPGRGVQRIPGGVGDRDAPAADQLPTGCSSPGSSTWPRSPSSTSSSVATPTPSR